METLLQDLKFALRTLAKSPAFTAVAVLTLALGIGANTAIFSAVNAVLLKPLPYPGSDRLVQVMSTGFRGVRCGVSFPDLHDLRALSQDFTGVAAVRTQRHNLTGAGDPREVQAAAVTADLFDVLHVHPELGQGFAAAEERNPLALLSHGLWVTNFGRDPGILGRSISLDGRSFTVVGVMPAGLQFPYEDVQVWTPMGEFLSQNPQVETDRGVHFLNAVARLAPGVSMERVVGDVKLLAARLSASDSGSTGAGRQLSVTGQASPGGAPAPSGGARSMLDTGFDVTLLRDVAIGDVRRPLLILLGAVGLVLLIACANGANLLLARATARRREMAVRRALGAGRGRLVRQLLTESTLLGLAAGVVGVVLAAAGLDALLGVWPHALPRTTDIGLDGAVLAFSLGLAVVTGVAFGLLPAWRASAPGIEQTLREDAPGATGGRRRLQSTLVVGEVTLALVLLVGAGLLVRSFIRLSNVDPGFDTHDVLAARIRLTPARYPAGAQQTLFFENMLAALQDYPGVQSASLAGTPPLSGNMFMIAFDPRTVRPDYPEPIMVLRLSVISPDYFTTFRIPIRRGRGFTTQDRAGAPPVAVINRATADQLWPGRDPIGRQLTIGFGARQPAGPITIVGLIDNLRSASLDARQQPEIYRPASQQSDMREMWVALRAGNGRPLRLVGAIRDAVHQSDPEQSIGEVVSLEQLIGRQTAARRFNTTLVTIFALLAVGLALVGIYGVTAYAVTQRTRELGIRMALGARGADVVRLLMRESLRRVAAGVGLGLLAALGVTRALSAMLFEVAPRDAVTFGATALLLVAVALLATWVPARRATKVDPMVALRYE